MKRSEIRDFIRAGVSEVAEIVVFDNGRISEFNSQRSNEYPFAWLEPLSVSTVLNNSVPQNTWGITIHVANLDSVDSTQEQYEAIVDDCDYLAQQLVKKYDDVISGSQLTTITNVNREPFYKKHADCLSGVILSFDLVDYDTTVIC